MERKVKGLAQSGVKQLAEAKRQQALALMLEAEELSPALPEIRRLMKKRLSLQESINPLRGDSIAQGVELAWGGLEHALQELKAHEGGTETELYRCLNECAAALMQADLRIKPRAIFYG